MVPAEKNFTDDNPKTSCDCGIIFLRRKGSEPFNDSDNDKFFISTKVTYSILNQVKIGHYLKLDAVVLAEKIVNFFLFCHYYLL